MSVRGRAIRVHDMSLRDGMRLKWHQISIEQMKTLAKRLGRSSALTWTQTAADCGVNAALVTKHEAIVDLFESARVIGLEPLAEPR